MLSILEWLPKTGFTVLVKFWLLDENCSFLLMLIFLINLENIVLLCFVQFDRHIFVCLCSREKYLGLGYF